MKLKTLLLFVPLLLLSSCFEFIEEVTYADADKGNCLLTLNCSQSKIKLKNLMKLDTFMGLNIPDVSRLRQDIANAKTLVAAIPGIHNVSTGSDFENFIFTIKFDFDSTASLNRALNAIAKAESKNIHCLITRCMKEVHKSLLALKFLTIALQTWPIKTATSD